MQTAGIIAGMESVYGIILAALVLKMPPTARELIGGAIALGVSLYTTISENGGNWPVAPAFFIKIFKFF